MSTIENKFSDISLALITAGGARETIQGTVDFIDGKFAQGGQRIFGGLTVTNLGSRTLGLQSGMHQELMKYSLCAGAGAVAIKGVNTIEKGVKERSPCQILKGLAQAAAGVAGVISIDALDSKVLLAAHQASLLGLTGLYLSKSGLDDLINGNYKMGASKVLLGVGGVAGAAYYAYHQFTGGTDLWHTVPPDTLTPEQSMFLKKHEAEIDFMYKNHEPTGSWKELGAGVSKVTYTHPDLKETIVKIPYGLPFRSDTDNDIRTHYMHLRNALQVVHDNNFQRIKIPRSVLVESPNGPFVVEQRFEMSSFGAIPDFLMIKEAFDETNSFLEKSNLCDVDLFNDHNASILKGTEHNPEVGFFDFDCHDKTQQTSVRRLAFGGAQLVAIAKVGKFGTNGLSENAVIIAGVTAGLLTTAFALGSLDESNQMRLESAMVLAGATAPRVAGGVVAAKLGCELLKKPFHIGLLATKKVIGALKEGIENRFFSYLSSMG